MSSSVIVFNPTLSPAHTAIFRKTNSETIVMIVIIQVSGLRILMMFQNFDLGSGKACIM